MKQNKSSSGWKVAFSYFVLGSQASGAQVQSLLLAIYSNSNPVNIRYPATIGVAFGVAHIMAKLG